MSTSEKRYEDMTAEERVAYDKEEQARELVEQAQLPYRWRQTLQEVDVSIPVPKGTRGRDVEVVIKKKQIKVALKGQPALIEGELCKEVLVDDCTWTIDNQQEVNVHLEKSNQQTWWENVVTTAPKINTKKIQPENSKLEDLDPETRAMVEKMMFDQRQKAMGQPMSDEIRKQNIMESFKKQHPEMDFSKLEQNAPNSMSDDD
ncbi:HSP20-like chaperone [Syncephalastrum racemosum]|uniref:Nuclear movement protein nudC n=1 Tax=Syncephalastrum racemosum TaxID=13706 RepID=A0A1X2HTI8_SYNRA|nr:HSP20-like chaperone [Syncephalastrum racemosum]